MAANGTTTFWEEYLSGAHVTNAFPSALDTGCEPSKDGPQGVGFNSTESCLTIDRDVSDQVLITAWILVAATHALQDDVVIGLDIEKRTDGVVPLRIRIPETTETSSTDLIEKVTAALDTVLSADAEHKSASERPKQVPSTTQAGEGGDIWDYSSCLHVLSGAGKLTPSSTRCSPLTVSCNRRNGSTTLALHVKESMYTNLVQQAMLAHFRQAVIKLLISEHASINDIDLLSEFDMEELSDWTQPPDPVPSQPFLHQDIEEQARQQPLSVAIGQTDMVMTYAELEDGANALAQQLLQQTSSEGTKVGNVAIVFPKSAFAVLAMLAVLKAGGAYVPIDPQWPVRRVSKILANAQISTILCAEDQQSRLRESHPDQLTVPVTQRSIYDLKKAVANDKFAPIPALRPEDIAYIIYTSGSTGDPKGVAISHGSISTAIKSIARYFAISTSTRTLQFNAFTFDVSVFDIWGTLSRGGRLCMPSENERFALNDFVGNERCNFALVTPSIAATIDLGVVKQYLHTLATIGEATSPEYLRRYAPNKHEGEDQDDWRLLDTYGPTEASVIATGTSPFTIKSGAEGKMKLLSQQAGNIGKPLGCGLFLVSPQDPHRLSPAFAPGEIALVGPTLATMYWGDEEKTKSAFRTDLQWAKDERWTSQFGAENMRRVYLTGDIARYSEHGDGSIVYMYRRGGGYVKVNGLRIDPGEVEAAVAEVGSKAANLDASQEALHWDRAAVCCLERNEGEDRKQMLVCFLAQNETKTTPRPDTPRLLEMTTSRKNLLHDIASRLSDIVPEYMTPTLYVLVSRMPMSTSGKLDRKAMVSLLDGMAWNEMVLHYGVSQDRRPNGVQ